MLDIGRRANYVTLGKKVADLAIQASTVLRESRPERSYALRLELVDVCGPAHSGLMSDVARRRLMTRSGNGALREIGSSVARLGIDL
jgi:hypothetical protein